ncbi:methyl-accepting chemotaxis protein [Moritella marina]|uniref:methyl-accepting chemotaxis protein n=1 Tax=Moritella marina TaxID=90736 RepID=UPI0037044D48
MPLKIKFIIFATFIFALFSTSFYMHGQLERTVSQNLHKVQTDYYPSLEIAITNNNLLMQFDQHIQTAVILAEEDYIDSALVITEQIDKNLQQLATLSLLHKSDAIELDKALLKHSEKAARVALDFIDGEKEVAQLALLAQQNAANLIQLVSQFKHIKKQLESEFEQLIIATLAEAKIAKQRFLWFNVIGLLVLMLAAVYAWRSSSKMSKNLKKVSHSLQGFAEGDGDLSIRIDHQGKDELADLVSWFNLFVARLQTSMQDTANNITELAEITTQLNSNSQQNLSSVQQQSQEVTATSLTINEMVIAISSITDSAISASQETVAANRSAIDGNAIIENTIDSITVLATEVESSADIVNELITFTAKVGGVINIIADIADQTNLLALNAAIEAARAGEQGRGFAVVADEVRNLASRTQSSTADIKQLLEGLNKISHSASSAMRSGVEQAHKSVKESYTAVETLAMITSKVSAINEINERIAAAAEQQRSASQLIGQSINTIETNSTHVQDNAHDLESITAKIQQISHQFQNLTKQFRL